MLKAAFFFILLFSYSVFAETLMMKPFITSVSSFKKEEAKLKQLFSAPLEAYYLKDNGRKHDNRIHLSVFSELEAEDYFNQMSDKRTIPFDYDVDGCYARAHRMARLAQMRGLQVGKIFALGSLRPRPGLGWRYHVAPTIAVKTDKGILIKVVDPSLAKTLVSVDEWLRLSTKESPQVGIQVYFTSRYIYEPEEIDESHHFFSLSDLWDTAKTLKKYRHELKRQGPHPDPFFD